MAKKGTVYICSNCTYQVSKWIGKCPECNEWNSFEEQSLGNIHAMESKDPTRKENTPIQLNMVDLKEHSRIKTNIDEFDRVLGGGLVPGSMILIGGEPGIGKSTLLTKVLDNLVISNNQKVLYVSGEESIQQIASRMKRMGISSDQLFILHESCWQTIFQEVKKIQPQSIVIDSIQTTVSIEIQSPAGSISQIREVAYEIMTEIKTRGITSFVIGHITKEGSIAGPKILEHMVDTVIYFEGDQHGHYRVLRSIKNRFGSANEVGLFEMTGTGLQEVSNPSQYFLDNNIETTFGRSLTCIIEGSRSLFVELQALVVANRSGNGRRTTHGIDNNRLAMLIAVLEKYVGYSMFYSDVFINVVGGFRLVSRDSDLSIVASLISSYNSIRLPPATVYLGEIGLGGEIRAVPKAEMRLKEMSQLNYKYLVTSTKIANEFNGKYDLKILGVDTVQEFEKALSNHRNNFFM